MQTCLHGYGHQQLLRLDTGVVWWRDGTVRSPALHARLYDHLHDEHLLGVGGDQDRRVAHAGTRWTSTCASGATVAPRHAVTGAPPPPWVMRYLAPLCAQALGGDLPPPRDSQET